MHTILRVAAILSLGLAATAVNAQLTPVASYTSLGTAKNLYWENTVPPSGAASGSLFTIATPTSTSPGSALVLFDFDPSTGVAATGIRAQFTLLGNTGPSSPAFLSGGVLTQPMIGGAFSFTAKALSGGVQVIGAYAIPDGTNLLTAIYTRARISGPAGGSKALFASDIVNGTLSFTSNFVDFSVPPFGPTPTFDFQIKITGITPALSAAPGRALSSFDPGSTGSFYAGSVPEPASWALMIAGFATTGTALRQRSRRRVAA